MGDGWHYIFYSFLQPYLHESRHQHAMRRARGNGGRFLNTKKLDSNGTQHYSEKNTGSGGSAPLQTASSSGSDPLHCNSTLDSSSGKQEVKGPMTHDKHEQHTYTNGIGCYQQHSNFPISPLHSLSGERGEESDCLGQQRSGMMVGQTPHRAVTIQWLLMLLRRMLPVCICLGTLFFPPSLVCSSTCLCRFNCYEFV